MNILSQGKLLIDALAENIRYDPDTKRYRYKGENRPGEPISGSFVSRDNVLRLQQEYLERVSQEFIDLAPRIISGEIGLYKDAANLLKRIHVSQGIIAAKGIDNLTNSELGSIGQILKTQYYQGKDHETGKPFGLKHLFKEIQSNPDYSEKMLRNRLRMYVESGEITKSVVEQSKAIGSGLKEMRRLDNNDDRECEDCRRYALAGWQLIGTLPLPKTKCQCRANCRCIIEYR